MSQLSQAQSELVESAYSLFGPPRLRNCPLRPSARQEAFLLLRERGVFFGGAAGGGKSLALLMAALQYSDVPGYDALLLRPSLSELQLAGGLIELSHEWLAGSRASWSAETRTWRFPGPGRRAGAGGSSLGFGYLANSDDLARYAGRSYSFLGVDELTRFSEQHYRRMFRVLRQPSASDGPAAPDGTRLGDVPVRVRATSNPGGSGHAWVKARFIDPQTRHPGVLYLPSRLADNPYLNQADYRGMLRELPLAERERLLNGDWEIPDEGELFQRAWFEIVEAHQLPERTRASATGTWREPSRRASTAIPTTPSASGSSCTRRAAPSTSPTSSGHEKHPARSSSWSRPLPTEMAARSQFGSSKNRAPLAKR
jgi:hypothetical protein